MTLSVNNERPSGDDDNDGRAPETGDPDGDAVDKAYSGLGFRRPHIANRAERANLDIEQMHLCAFEVGA